MERWRISARNQGHLNDAIAPNVKEFSSIFADRPENIRDAFVSAVKIWKLLYLPLQMQKIKYFVKGPAYEYRGNDLLCKTIPQNADMLVFHGTQAYDSVKRS